jgi:CRP-like cAMP-binding protein
MSLQDDIIALERAPLFSEIGRDALRLLAFSADARRLSPGEFLFRKGARAEGAYVIAHGELDLLATDKIVLRQVGPGALIGETALIIEGERPFSARASSACEVIGISRSVFRRVLEEFPEIVSALQLRLGERLRADQMALEEIRSTLNAMDKPED